MAEGRPSPAESLRTSDLVILAAAFGLVAGLVEGAALRYLQNGPLAGATINSFLVSRGVVFVAPLVDAALFAVLVLLLRGLGLRIRVLRADISAVFLLFFLLIFDWLSLVLDRVMDPLVIVILSVGISAALARGLWKRAPRMARLARVALPALATVLAIGMIALPAEGSSTAEETARLPRPLPDSPNVLIIVLDTVRADHLSLLGYERATTLNLEHLAGQGVLFEFGISTSSWTLPAHASLLTGRFPFEHGAELHAYDGRFPTLGEVLETRGYRTAAFSANTFYFTPQNGFGRGFLRFDGLLTSPADALSRPFYSREFVTLYQEASYSDLPGRKHADQINRDFLGWLRRDTTRPFFAVLNYFDAHAPYLPPAPYRARFSTRPDPGGILNYVADRETLDKPAEVRDETDAYDGAIAYEDAQVESLLAALRQSGLDSKTIVLVTSDHGEFLGEHGLFLHRNALYLEGIRVPVLLLWPGHLPAGVRVAAPVSIAALPATLMELIPGPRETSFPGPSLAPFWAGGAPPVFPPFVLSELVDRHPAPHGGEGPRTESLLTAEWHFLYTQNQSPQLFDRRADPREQNNLAATPEGRPIAQRIMSCLADRSHLVHPPFCGLSEVVPAPAALSAAVNRSNP